MTDLGLRDRQMSDENHFRFAKHISSYEIGLSYRAKPPVGIAILESHLYLQLTVLSIWR